MAPVNTIKAVEIVGDIRSGMLDTELMDKYRLSSTGLQIAFRKLVNAEAVTESEILNRNHLHEDTTGISQYRQLSRNFLVFPIHICDSDDPDTEGYVVDVTERGLQVTGIETEVGRTGKFLVRADESFQVNPFPFEAQCRWSKTGQHKEDFSAGFEITDISDGARKELRKLIQALSLGDTKDHVEATEQSPSPPVEPESSLVQQDTARVPEAHGKTRGSRFATIARRSMPFVLATIVACAAIGPVLMHIDPIGNDMALIDAARNGVIDEVKVLLFKGADANAKTNKGSTALMWASYNGYGKIAKLLVDAGADVDAQDTLGNTALIFAALRNNSQVVRLLLQKGADANVTEKNGYTALRWASGKGHTEIKEILRPLTREKETTLSKLP